MNFLPCHTYASAERPAAQRFVNWDDPKWKIHQTMCDFLKTWSFNIRLLVLCIWDNRFPLQNMVSTWFKVFMFQVNLLVCTIVLRMSCVSPVLKLHSDNSNTRRSDCQHAFSPSIKCYSYHPHIHISYHIFETSNLKKNNNWKCRPPGT